MVTGWLYAQWMRAVSPRIAEALPPSASAGPTKSVGVREALAVWGRRLLIGGVCALLGGLAWWMADYRASRTDAAVRDGLRDQAWKIAHSLGIEQVRALTFTPADKGTPAFETVRSQLVAYGKAINQYSIYTIAVRDGRIVFGPENLPPGDAMASPVGTVYEQPPLELQRLFRDGGTLDLGPFSDEYGIFVSAFASVRDPRSGRVLLVVGLDCPAEQWERQLLVSRIRALIQPALLLFVFLGGLQLIGWRTRQSPERQRRFRHLEALTAGVTGLLLTGIATGFILEMEHRERRTAFRESNRAQTFCIQATLQDVAGNLGILGRYCHDRSGMTRADFESLVTPWVEARAIQAYAWIPRVPAAERPLFEERFCRSGDIRLALWERDPQRGRVPAADRREYFPVCCAAPTSENRSVLGFDLGSDPACREALDRAVWLGRSVASDPVMLAPDGVPFAGALVVHPVFDSTPDAADSSRVPPTPAGFAAAVISFQDLISRSLCSSVQSEESEMAVWALAESGAGREIASFPDGAVGSEFSAPRVHGDSMSFISPLFLFGRAYAVAARPSPRFYLEHPFRNSWSAGLAGILLTGMLTALVGSLGRRRHSLEDEVERRTAQLRASEERFHVMYTNSADALMTLVPPQWTFSSANPAAVQMFGVGDEEDLTEKTLVELSPETQEGGGPSASRLREEIEAALGAGSRYFEWTFRKCDGEVFPGTVMLTRLNLGGKTLLQATVRDITVRKRVEMEMRLARDEWETTFNAVPDLIAILDLQQRVVRINRTMAERLHVTQEEAVGKRCYELIHGLDHPLPRCPHCTAEKTGRECQAELFEPKLDAWYDVSTTPLVDSTGRLYGAVHVSRDITHRKKVEKALRESATRLNAIFEYVQAGILLVDPVTRKIAAVNLKAAEMCGAAPEDMVNKVCHQYVCPAERDQCPVVDLHQKADNAERELLRADGRRIPVLKTVTRIDLGGKDFLLESFVDISERKRAEEYLRSIMSTIQAGVVVTERETEKILDINPVASRVLGLVGQEANGLRWGESLGVVAPPGPVENGALNDCRVIGRDGEAVDIRIKQADVDIQGRFYRVRSFIDISDIKRLLAEQEVNIDLATQVLRLVNSEAPRHIDLAGGNSLFVEGFSVSCRAAGGDHFFVQSLPAAGGSTLISIKDQSGHEVNCVLRSIVTDLLHHIVLIENPSAGLSETTERLNELICRTGFFPADEYVTAAMARIDPASMTLQYISCGHPPILLIRGTRVVRLPDDAGPGRAFPLAFLPEQGFTCAEIPLQAGDRLLFHTDGFTAMPLRCRGRTVGEAELVHMTETIIGDNAAMPVTELMSRLLHVMNGVSGEEVIPFDRNTTADDVTLVGIEIEPAPAFQETLLYPQSDGNISDLTAELSTRICRQWGADRFPSQDMRVRLLLEESVLNAWRHAHRESGSKPIRVRWWKQNDYMIEITDQGEGFDPDAVPDPRTPGRRQRMAGRGIFLVKTAADEVRWLDGGRRLVAAFGPRLHPLQGSKKRRRQEAFAS